MIIGAHTVLHAADAERARAFFRDVLGLRTVDAGQGWLIFALPPGELGVHPDATGGRHQLYLMCDDIDRTVAELTRKGVEFTGPPQDCGWGVLATMRVPGAGEIGLYEPRHPLAIHPAPR